MHLFSIVSILLLSTFICFQVFFFFKENYSPKRLLLTSLRQSKYKFVCFLTIKGWPRQSTSVSFKPLCDEEPAASPYLSEQREAITEDNKLSTNIACLGSRRDLKNIFTETFYHLVFNNELD